MFSTKSIQIYPALKVDLALPGLGAGGSSKFALEGFSGILNFELYPFGIEVILLEPGTYYTKAIDENKQKKSLRGADLNSPYYKFSNRLKGLHSKLLDTRKGVGDLEDAAIIIERIIKRK